jgi:hypothetical protein
MSAIGAKMTTGANVTVAPVINVDGGSRGEEADQKLGATISKQLEAMVRGVVADETRRQMRAGGILNR